MRLRTRLSLSMAAVAAAGLFAAAPARLQAQTAVAIDADDIGGVVTGPNGPEAGVWVIADALRQDGGHRRPGPLRPA